MLTYAECLVLIKGARNGRKKLDHNTYLYQVGVEFHVVLHQTAVVRILSNNKYILNSGGWYTPTTKDRINRFSPVRINQKRGEWFLDSGREFQDGMVVAS